eukprot:2540960-Pleurochrysis_carterae.AAC.1
MVKAWEEEENHRERERKGQSINAQQGAVSLQRTSRAARLHAKLSERLSTGTQTLCASEGRSAASRTVHALCAESHLTTL